MQKLFHDTEDTIWFDFSELRDCNFEFFVFYLFLCPKTLTDLAAFNRFFV